MSILRQTCTLVLLALAANALGHLVAWGIR